MRTSRSGKKFFLDFITLGIAIYGYYNYQSYTGIITATGKSAVNVQIDPLLFLISSLFIIGAGLLFLRIYPYLIRLVFFLRTPPLEPDDVRVVYPGGALERA